LFQNKLLYESFILYKYYTKFFIKSQEKIHIRIEFEPTPYALTWRSPYATNLSHNPFTILRRASLLPSV
jgi:hypothetical protein